MFGVGAVCGERKNEGRARTKGLEVRRTRNNLHKLKFFKSKMQGDGGEVKGREGEEDSRIACAMVVGLEAGDLSGKAVS